MGADFWLPLIIGVVLFGSAANELVKIAGFRRRAQQVRGTVVGLHRSVGGTGGAGPPKTRYHPILSFTTAEGKPVRARTNVGSDPPIAREGDQVTVIYDPRKPAEVEIAGKGWLRPALVTFAMLMGAGILGVLVYSVVG